MIAGSLVTLKQVYRVLIQLPQQHKIMGEMLVLCREQLTVIKVRVWLYIKQAFNLG